MKTTPLSRKQLLWLLMNFYFCIKPTPKAYASSQDQNYGLGGTSSGRVGSVTADLENPYAVVSNPALLASGEKATLALGSYFVNSSFENLGMVVRDSRKFRTQTGEYRREQTSLTEIQRTLWSASFRYPFKLGFWDKRKAGLGTAVTGSLGRLRAFDSGTPYDFYPLRYGAADSQFKVIAGLGVELIPQKLLLGIGIHGFISGAGNSDASLTAENPTARMILDVSLQTSISAGVYYQIDSDQQVALNFRESIAPQVSQKIVGNVEIAGSPVFQQPMMIKSSLYFEPHLLELEYQRQFKRLKTSAGLSYQMWKSYAPRFLIVESQDITGKTIQSEYGELKLRNTFSPRISGQYELGNDWVVAAGYRYMPSPMEDLSGPTNLLDTDTHVVGTSVSHQFTVWDSPLKASVFGQLHVLKDRDITKSNPEFIGAPGYHFAGKVYSVGASLEVAL